MKKQLYRLTESDIRNIMESVTKRILKEGSTDTTDLTTWENIKEEIGAENMLDLIWNCLDSSDVREILDYIKQQLEADGMYQENDDYPSF